MQSERIFSFSVCNAIWMEIENKHCNCQLWQLFFLSLSLYFSAINKFVVSYWVESVIKLTLPRTLSHIMSMWYLISGYLSYFHTCFSCVHLKTYWANHQHTRVRLVVYRSFASISFFAVNGNCVRYNLKRPHIHNMHDNIDLLFTNARHPVFLHFVFIEKAS